MARLVNVGRSVHLYGLAGSPDSLFVEQGQVVDVPGDVESERDDAYLIRTPSGEVRAWSKAQWQLEKAEKPAAKARGADKEE